MKWTHADPRHPGGVKTAWLAAMLFGLALMLCAPCTALACQCGDTGSSLVWPLDGAALSLEPVFVVQSGNLADLHLLDEQGSELRLLEFRSIAETEGCSGSTHFLRPDGPLVAQGYELRRSEKAPKTGYRVLGRFTAVPGLVPSDAPEPTLSYYRLLPREECTLRNGQPCPARAEFSVSEGTVASAEDISWLVLRAAEQQSVTRLGGTSQGYLTFYLALEQAAEAPCVDVELINARGLTQRSDSLCEPRACAVDLGIGATQGCSSNPSAIGEPLWSQVEPGPCDHPAGARSEEGAVVVSNHGDQGAGCSVMQPASAPSTFAWGLSLLGVMVRYARRRTRQGMVRRTASKG